MSYKVGLILSMVFVALFFAFGIDLVTIQFAFSNLDSVSVAVSYKLSNYGLVDETFISNIENTYHVSFTCLSNCTPSFGDVVEYTLARQINPIVISQDPMTIAIKRTAIIGYYS